MNENFVLMYLLANSDEKLKIKLMNLVKNMMAIPLYITHFKTIFDISISLQPNSEILWVLEKGMTVCSIGLHSE
jgi:hypothetical protein